MGRKRPARPITRTSDVLDIQDYLKYKNYRDYVLFLVGVTTGYRAGDLVNLKVRDIKEAMRKKEFTIYEGKKMNSKKIRERNRKPRTVELIPELAKILKEYIRDKKDYEYMFKSRKGTNKPIGVQAVTNAIKQAANYFGLYDITAHSMRKTYAYKIYIESDRDIVVVKELLGHSSIEETKRYIGLDREKYHQYSKSLRDFVR
ncbi:tyrosine-type recombinase/integrase [Clostridium paraputrificum]|uniref:tyrosine-type recombinase/integrase n=1 Tax=Clostridium paraputrificum TaxID=29363 RepID=UPI000DD0C064|nr:tyrosine-type recombinase/integrase [Clostridium paraputrificum]DAU88759.1 MAG TPA: site specific tyrosine recombinase [Caudoviricetes sp.]